MYRPGRPRRQYACVYVDWLLDHSDHCIPLCIIISLCVSVCVCRRYPVAETEQRHRFVRLSHARLVSQPQLYTVHRWTLIGFSVFFVGPKQRKTYDNVGYVGTAKGGGAAPKCRGGKREAALPADDFNLCLEFRPTIRYDTRCYCNVQSKADVSKLNLPHGNSN